MAKSCKNCGGVAGENKKQLCPDCWLKDSLIHNTEGDQIIPR